MNYVYPKLSEHDCFLFRMGGSGLGNLLFTYARALVFANEHQCVMIWPTWPSVKLGPWIRREADKRLYADLFRNRSHYVSGLSKARLLAFGHHVTPEAFRPEADGQVVMYRNFQMNFDGLKEHRAQIGADVYRNLHPKNAKAMEFDFSDSISVHIRLGDFAKSNVNALMSGVNNMSIPVSWYAEMIIRLREIIGREVPVWIFSDGTDAELGEVLSLPGVRRLTFGTGISDIIALSRATMLIASGSSFSMWARFLGGLSTITFTNQLKDRILTDAEEGFELECADAAAIDGDAAERIRKIYQQ